jgi:hypothetical protein
MVLERLRIPSIPISLSAKIDEADWVNPEDCVSEERIDRGRYEVATRLEDMTE